MKLSEAQLAILRVANAGGKVRCGRGVNPSPRATRYSRSVWILIDRKLLAFPQRGSAIVITDAGRAALGEAPAPKRRRRASGPSIDYRTTRVGDAARIMLARHGVNASEIARNREDAADTEAGAGFWQRVGDAIDRT